MLLPTRTCDADNIRHADNCLSAFYAHVSCVRPFSTPCKMEVTSSPGVQHAITGGYVAMDSSDGNSSNDERKIGQGGQWRV